MPREPFQLLDLTAALLPVRRSCPSTLAIVSKIFIAFLPVITAAARSYGLDLETHKTLGLALSVVLGHPTSDFTLNRPSFPTRWLFLCSTVTMTSVDLDCRQLGRDSLAANELETTSSGHHRRGSDQSEDLVSLNELLRGACSAQDPAPAGQ